jgi:hypothetical protein
MANTSEINDVKKYRCLTSTSCCAARAALWFAAMLRLIYLFLVAFSTAQLVVAALLEQLFWCGIRGWLHHCS